jgi:16S rRNA (cytidine1402-2'-O)-methyltransferase
MHIGVSKPMVSYYQHNRTERGEEICKRLLAGESCALVTDAGTPAISDPGEDLVRLCGEKGIKVTFVPGACAAIAALALSGLFTGRFAFEGFISGARGERKERLTELSAEKRTLIFYEAPHHLVNTLNDLYEFFGDRKIALCRELTKLNEEIMRTTLSAAKEYYSVNQPRGEYVIIVEGKRTEEVFWAGLTPAEHVNFYINNGMQKNDAIKAAAKDRGVHKSEIYKEILKSDV